METNLDRQRQEKAKEYARIRRRLMAVDLLWNGFYAAWWLASGWALVLKQYLLSYTDNIWVLVGAFAIVYGGMSFVLTLPLSFYSGFLLPHRYGMSNQARKDWVIDRLKGIAVGAPIGLIVLEVIYAVLRAYPNSWWLWAAGFMLLFKMVLANLFPTLIAPIFNKYTPLDDEHNDLSQRLMRLAEQANTRVEGVYKFDMSRRTKAANAALTGLGSSRRIILGDTLIDEFTDDEIETVLAHELGHHANKDIPISILVNSLVTLIGFYLASQVMRYGVQFFGFESSADIAALPLFGLVLGLYGLITMPLGNAYSRWRERHADQYALAATGNGQAYASALRRLTHQNLADADPEPWVEFLLYSHPAPNKRIGLAEAFDEAASRHTQKPN